MSAGHPWRFDPVGSLTDEDVKELNELAGHLRSASCDNMTQSLAKHFVHEDTAERGKGTDAQVDPIDAYQRAMKVCG